MTENGSAASNPADDAGRHDDDEPLKQDDAVESSEPGKASPRHDDQDREIPKSRNASSRQVSLSLRTLIVSTAFLLLLAAVSVMTWLYFGERGKVEAQLRQADNAHHAEQIALHYAVNAATMNFQDLNTWKGKLVNGTTTSLNDKLTKAASSMQQILVPLEWNSTAQPLVAKVRSDTNGIYVVDTFVSVLTKTTQAPDSLQSTATYSITIDSKDNWQISDVGGIGAVVGAK
jgi:Mce-associated membrane protein